MHNMTTPPDNSNSNHRTSTQGNQLEPTVAARLRKIEADIRAIAETSRLLGMGMTSWRRSQLDKTATAINSLGGAATEQQLREISNELSTFLQFPFLSREVRDTLTLIVSDLETLANWVPVRQMQTASTRETTRPSPNMQQSQTKPVAERATDRRSQNYLGEPITGDNYLRVIFAVLGLALGIASLVVPSSLLAPIGLHLALAGLIVCGIALMGSVADTATRYIGVSGLILNVASAAYLIYRLAERQVEVEELLPEWAM